MLHAAFSRRRSLPVLPVVLLLAAPVFGGPPPNVSVTQTDAFPTTGGDNQAEPGEQIDYTTTIKNTGSDALGVRFQNAIPADTTFVAGSLKSTPLALDDSYNSYGNVGISISAPGLLANDYDLGPQAPTVVPASGNSNQGGTFQVFANGSFDYDPPTGFNGLDSFPYTIQDENGPNLPAPATGSNTATVRISTIGMIWFIDDTAPAGGDGSLDAPYDTLSDQDSNPNNVSGDAVFLFTGTYPGGLTLLNNQPLIGQGVTGSLDSVLSITLPPGSNSLPPTGATRPVIGNTTGNGINLGSNNTVRGLDVGNTSGEGLNGSSVGTLTISEVSVNGPGGGVDLRNGALSVTFDSISSASSSNGINLSSTTGTFTVTGTGSSGSGGTLNGHQYGIRLNNATNVSLRFMDITNSQEDGIRGDTVAGFTFRDSTISNFGTSGSTGIAPGDSTIESEPESGIDLRGATGTFTIEDSTIGPDDNYVASTNPPSPENHGIQIFNDNHGLIDVTITGSTFNQISNTPVFISANNSDVDFVANNAGGTNVFSNYNGGGIDIQDETDQVNNSDITIDVDNNTFTNPAIGARWTASGGTNINARFINNSMTGTTNTAVRCLGNDGSTSVDSEVHSRIAGNSLGGDGTGRGGLLQVARRGSEHFVLNGDPSATQASPSNTAGGGLTMESSRGATLHHTSRGNVFVADAGAPFFTFATLFVQIIEGGLAHATYHQDLEHNVFTLSNASANFVDAITYDDNGDSGHTHTFEGFTGTTLDQAGQHILNDNNTVNGSGSFADTPFGSGVQFFFGGGIPPSQFTDPDNDIDHPTFP